LDDRDARQSCLVGEHLNERIERPGGQFLVAGLAVVAALSVGLMPDALQVAQDAES
jgi:hypothetical protein